MLSKICYISQSINGRVRYSFIAMYVLLWFEEDPYIFLRKDSVLIDNCTILVINIIPHLMDFSCHDILYKFLG